MIRDLTETRDQASVAAFYRAAPDDWLLAEGACDPERQAAAFFTDAPPGCDRTASDRLGLVLDGRLSGVAELAMASPSRATPIWA